MQGFDTTSIEQICTPYVHVVVVCPALRLPLGLVSISISIALYEVLWLNTAIKCTCMRGKKYIHVQGTTLVPDSDHVG